MLPNGDDYEPNEVDAMMHQLWIEYVAANPRRGADSDSLLPSPKPNSRETVSSEGGWAAPTSVAPLLGAVFDRKGFEWRGHDIFFTF